MRPLALVTGGGHRLGAVIALRLAEAGHDLALHVHSSPPDDALIERLDALGCAWSVFAADFADAAAVAALVPAVAARLGRVPAVLINNASLFTDDDWRSFTADSLARHFAINTGAAMVLAQAVAAGGQADTAIVNVLDQRIASPHGDQLSYTISKQALAAATATLARALAPNARVCAVAPGLILPTAEYGAAQLERLAEAMPLGRLPTADEVADAVLYLLSARSTTGQTLFVDGGAGLVSFDRDFVRLATDAKPS